MGSSVIQEEPSPPAVFLLEVPASTSRLLQALRRGVEKERSSALQPFDTSDLF